MIWRVVAFALLIGALGAVALADNLPLLGVGSGAGGPTNAMLVGGDTTSCILEGGDTTTCIGD